MSTFDEYPFDPCQNIILIICRASELYAQLIGRVMEFYGEEEARNVLQKIRNVFEASVLMSNEVI